MSRNKKLFIAWGLIMVSAMLLPLGWIINDKTLNLVFVIAGLTVFLSGIIVFVVNLKE